MARLDPLMKVRKHAVDEKQKVLSALYREQEKILMQKESLIAQMMQEQALVEKSDNMDLKTAFGPYLTSVQNKIESLDDMLAKLETRIVVALDDIRTAFGDLKKIEIVDRERKKTETKKKNAKEQAMFDDVAITRHAARKNEEDSES